jgi:glycosyltransferase involved in cell wall biosynthesis
MSPYIQEQAVSSKPEIDVLLATWNGVRFLDHQLDSLSRQSFQNFRVLVRDDDSSDSTLQIVERFQSLHPDRVFIRKNSTRQGPCRTFSLLAEESQAPYFAFCDQDDVWRSDKLELEMNAMKRAEANYGYETPVMVFSDLELIGADNRRLEGSMWTMKHVNPHRANLARLLVQNLVTGCTVLGNHSLLSHSLPIPDGALMHDSWLGLVASAFGVLVPIDETTVRYRQHEQNALGAGRGLRLRDVIKHLLQDPDFKEAIEKSRKQARTFSERYATQFSHNQRRVLQAWSRSKDLPAGVRQWTLYRSGLRPTRFLTTLGFLARI